MSVFVAQTQGCPPPPGRGASLLFAISALFNLWDKGSAGETNNQPVPFFNSWETTCHKILKLTDARMLLGQSVGLWRDFSNFS